MNRRARPCRRVPCIALLVLACFAGLIATVRAAPIPPLLDAGLGQTVREILPIARRKLMKADCRAIFLEFRSRSGRSLQQELERLGKAPAGHLMELILLDGSHLPLCRRPGMLAVSVPGTRVVHLCGDRFRELARRSPHYAANILIHEQLHALGLLENPPSSEEITARIALRCGW